MQRRKAAARGARGRGARGRRWGPSARLRGAGGSVPAPSPPPRNRPLGRRGCAAPGLPGPSAPESVSRPLARRGPGGELYARVDVRGLARRRRRRTGRAPTSGRSAPAFPPRAPPGRGRRRSSPAAGPQRVKWRGGSPETGEGHCRTSFSGKQILWVSVYSPRSSEFAKPSSEYLNAFRAISKLRCCDSNVDLAAKASLADVSEGGGPSALEAPPS